MILLRGLVLLVVSIKILNAEHLRNLKNQAKILNKRRKELYQEDDWLDHEYYQASDVKPRDCAGSSATESSKSSEDSSTDRDFDSAAIPEETRKGNDVSKSKYNAPLWEELLSSDEPDDLSMSDIRYFDVTDYRNRLDINIGRDKYRLKPNGARPQRSASEIQTNAEGNDAEFYSLPEKLEGISASRRDNNDNDTRTFLGTADLTRFWNSSRRANNAKERIYVLKDIDGQYPTFHGERRSESLDQSISDNNISFWKPLEYKDKRKKPAKVAQKGPAKQKALKTQKIVPHFNDVHASMSPVMAKAVTRSKPNNDTKLSHVLFSNNMGMLGLWGETGRRSNLRSMKNDIGPLDMWQSIHDIEKYLTLLTEYSKLKQYERENHSQKPEDLGRHDHSQKAHIYENTYVKDQLFKKIRVLCWVPTYKKNHKTRAIHVKRTWGPRCNKLLFFSDAYDVELKPVLLHLPEDYSYLWGKTQKAFEYVYKNHTGDYDWVLKADDDTYVILENLRYMLLNYSADDALYFGLLTHQQDKKIFNFAHGGAYVLSKEAVRRFVTRNPELCQSKKFVSEDVCIGECLDLLNVKAVNAVDKQNLPMVDFYPVPGMGVQIFSEYSWAFMNVDNKSMPMIDYMVYHARPFGIQYKSPEKEITRGGFQ